MHVNLRGGLDILCIDLHSLARVIPARVILHNTINVSKGILCSLLDDLL